VLNGRINRALQVLNLIDLRRVISTVDNLIDKVKNYKNNSFVINTKLYPFFFSQRENYTYLYLYYLDSYSSSIN
jgi:hypothetical protein